MPLSDRIIRGHAAQNLQAWKIDTVGSHHANRVEQLFSTVGAQPHQQAQAQPEPLSERELALQAWEAQLAEREAQLSALEHQTRQQAEQEGKQRGYEAGWDAAHHERVALIQAANTLETEFEAFKVQLADKVLDLAVLVAKKVVGDTVTLHTEQATELLRDVLGSMNLDPRQVTLVAHPTTLQVLEAQFGDQQELGGLKLQADPKQLAGGFVLRHPEGEVDATLQSRWLRATEALNRRIEIEPSDLQSPSDSAPNQAPPTSDTDPDKE